MMAPRDDNSQVGTLTRLSLSTIPAKEVDIGSLPFYHSILPILLYIGSSNTTTGSESHPSRRLFWRHAIRAIRAIRAKTAREESVIIICHWSLFARFFGVPTHRAGRYGTSFPSTSDHHIITSSQQQLPPKGDGQTKLFVVLAPCTYYHGLLSVQQYSTSRQDADDDTTRLVSSCQGHRASSCTRHGDSSNSSSSNSSISQRRSGLNRVVVVSDLVGSTQDFGRPSPYIRLVARPVFSRLGRSVLVLFSIRQEYCIEQRTKGRAGHERLSSKFDGRRR